MTPEDFNRLPADAFLVINDIKSFCNHINVTTTTEAARIVFNTIFAKDEKSQEMIVMYAKKVYNNLNALYPFENYSGYFYENEEEGLSEVDKLIRDNQNITYKIHKGDVDVVGKAVMSDMTYKILSEMEKDKIVVTCWDPKQDDFIWKVLPKVNKKK